MDTKTCKTCLETKPIKDFPQKGNSYVRPHCKPCFNAMQKMWRERDPERIKASWRKASKTAYSTEKRVNKKLKSYGLTNEDYDALFNAQQGKCKICLKDLPLVIDHCHTNLVVRGLLCGRCNVGLGCFEDSIENLESAINYLNNSK